MTSESEPTGPTGNGPTGNGPTEGGEQPVRRGDGEEPQLDVDTAFAAIVAAWANEATPPVGVWPAAEDVDPAQQAGPGGGQQGPGAPGGDRSGPDGPPPGPSATIRVEEPPEPQDRMDRPAAPRHRQEPGRDEVVLPPVGDGPGVHRAPGPRDYEPAEGADEGFVPPEPPPLPRGDLISRLLWLGVIGGPLFLLIVAVAWQDAPQLLKLAAVAAFAGGFVALVVRMPRDRTEDDDDGAVV